MYDFTELRDEVVSILALFRKYTQLESLMQYRQFCQVFVTFLIFPRQ